MAQRPSFDMSKLSTASKILLVGGLLYFIDLFLPWNRACGVAFPGLPKVCFSASGFHGLGIINAILALVILVMEILVIAGVDMSNMGSASTRNMVEAGLAGGLLVFTLLKILVDHSSLYLFAFVGIILAIVIAYGGYMRWQEASVSTPPPASGGGGFAP
jgi:hypothetical protein